ELAREKALGEAVGAERVGEESVAEERVAEEGIAEERIADQCVRQERIAEQRIGKERIAEEGVAADEGILDRANVLLRFRVRAGTEDHGQRQRSPHATLALAHATASSSVRAFSGTSRRNRSRQAASRILAARARTWPSAARIEARAPL